MGNPALGRSGAGSVAATVGKGEAATAFEEGAGEVPAPVRARPVADPYARHTNPLVGGMLLLPPYYAKGIGGQKWRSLKCQGAVLNKSGLQKCDRLKVENVEVIQGPFSGADDLDRFAVQGFHEDKASKKMWAKNVCEVTRVETNENKILNRRSKSRFGSSRF